MEDGIVRANFESSHQKRRFKEGLNYPAPYAGIALEQEYKNDTASVEAENIAENIQEFILRIS